MAVNKNDGLTVAAQILIKISNPCILSIILLTCLAVTSGEKVSGIIAWCALVLVFLVVIPLFFIFKRISMEQGKNNRRADPTLFLKRHPRQILFLGLACGLPLCFVLVFLKAPADMLHTLIALLLTACLIAFINLYYRASFHLSALTIIVTMSAVTWGNIWLVLTLALPLVGWAKYHTREHNPLQMLMGVALAAAITFYFYF